MKNWNMSLPWVRKSDYILRCTEETFGPSNGGSPMVTLKFEVASPATVEINGEEVNVAGVPLTHYCVVKNLTGYQSKDGFVTPEEATKKAQERFIKLLAQFDLPTENINWDNPTLGFKGKTVWALLDDDAKEERGAPTKADLDKGIKVGPILINPKTKMPLVKHYPKIVDFFGTAELSPAGSL